MESIKELRSRNKADTIKRRVIPGRPILDQVISANKRDGGMKVRAPGPGLKRQASSNKLREIQASSGKHQALRCKHQATSRKQQAPGSGTLQKVSSTFDQGTLPR